MPRRAARAEPIGSFPVDAFVGTIVESFLASVDALSDADAGFRASTMKLLLVLEKTSKTMRSSLEMDHRLPFYRFFVATAASNPAPRRFLDATFGVVLMDGDFGLGPSNPERFGRLTAREALQDRVATAAKLATIDESKIETSCAKYLPVDLPAGVHKRVAALVGRSRFLARRLALHQPRLRQRCSLASCDRDFVGEPVGAAAGGGAFGHDAASGSESDDEIDEIDEAPPTAQDENSYWRLLSTTPAFVIPPKCFCCLDCSLAFEAELAAVVPISSRDLERCDGVAVGKAGLTRVLAEARAAFKRNAAVARALRESVRCYKRIPMPSISFEHVQRIHAEIVGVVNVDLALVAAAAAAAEASSAIVGLALPATAPDWRRNGKCWSKSIAALKALYTRHNQHNTNLDICISERLPPRWLRRVRDAGPGIF